MTIRNNLITVSAAITCLIAQSALVGQNAITTASIAGAVQDSGTGMPMPDVAVFAVGPSSTRKETRTDSHGNYAFKDLPPGSYRVSVYDRSRTGPYGAHGAKSVTLTPGRGLTRIDFNLERPGQILGKVMDEYKQPLSGISVFLIVREYSLGALRHVFARVAETDDQGEYRLSGVEPGRAYIIMADKRLRKLPAISDVPTDPKLRKHTAFPMFYPGSAFIAGAQSIVLRSGERREAVDMVMVGSPSYCIDGMLTTPAGPTKLRFEIASREPTSGNGFYIVSSNGLSGSDGKIRVCDLSPGEYQITALQVPLDDEAIPAFLGTARINITDGDVHKIILGTRPSITVRGEVVWDSGTAPKEPPASRLKLNLDPRTRLPWQGELHNLHAEASIPGDFSFPNLLIDEYAVTVGSLSGVYVKEATYAGANILYEPLRVGSSIGDLSMRIVLAFDGAIVNTTVSDKDGNPVADANVLIVPAKANSEALAAATMIFGQTDQDGTYTSKSLPPGKYYVMATTVPINRTPETISGLWRARSRAEEIDLGPSATITLKLEPKAIE